MFILSSECEIVQKHSEVSTLKKMLCDYNFGN